MKEILTQISNNQLVPLTLEDKAVLAEFKPNQIVRCQVYGIQKERSVPQLRLFWACCATVAENTKDVHWNTREKVAQQIKVAANFIDLNRTIVDPMGNIHFHYRSIAFKNLRHLEACNLFDQAFEIMAKKLKINVDELLANSE